MAPTFDAVAQRVLGVLAEKEATVPDTYPLTLNALVAGCNQKTSREPLMELDDHTVQRTLDELKARGFVRFVHPSHGARSTKYRHVVHEQLSLDEGELALLTVLLLRGPQTLSELRSRTERAHAFATLDEVEVTLDDLAGRDEPLVEHLARRPGQKETRWAHRLGDVAELPDAPEAPVAMAAAPTAPAEPSAPSEPAVDLESRVAELEARVELLESVIDGLDVPRS